MTANFMDQLLQEILYVHLTGKKEVPHLFLQRISVTLGMLPPLMKPFLFVQKPSVQHNRRNTQSKGSDTP